MKKMLLLTVATLLFTCFQANAYGPFHKYAQKVSDYPFIVIDKTALVLTLVDKDGYEIVHYGCAAGVNKGNKRIAGDHKTPEGTFKINELLKSGYLSHDFGDGKGPVKGAYGPWFLRLEIPGTRVIGIHGTHLPESIGTRCTEGCIRLRNADIEDLKGRVRLGTPVIILPDVL